MDKDSSYTRFHSGGSDNSTNQLSASGGSSSVENNPIADILKAISNNPTLMEKLQSMPEPEKNDLLTNVQDFLNNYKTSNTSGTAGNITNTASSISSVASGLSSSGVGYLATSAGMAGLASLLPQILEIGSKLYGRYEIAKMYDPKSPEGRARLSNIMSSFQMKGHNAQFSDNTMQNITQNISNLLQSGRDIEYASALKLFNGAK